MDRETLRLWGPVALVLALLPVAFAVLRAVVPPIGPDPADPDPADAPAPAADPPDAPAGSAACAGCHPAQFQAWAASHHAAAERALGEAETAALGPDGTLLLDGPDGEAPYRPVRAIGVSPVVQFLVPFPGGRLQVTQRAWDPAAAEWFDVFDDGRAPGEWGHWTGGGMTWNAQCAACHDTGVRRGHDPRTGAYDTRVAELGVGCAACHGALGDHAQGLPDRPPVGLDTCAGCHARRAELVDRGVPGARFLDRFAPQLVDATDAFWPDGQVREEDFEYTAFVGSEMHAAGVVCTSCHDPHGGGLLAEGDALCLRCHDGLPGFAPHDRHPPDAAPGCVGCHMPVTVYMQRDPRHDHGFVVPDPAGRAALGIPDPCDRCHADRPPGWTASRAAAWYGDLGGDDVRRARAVAGGRAGDPASVGPLLAMLREDRPAWRAGAALVLGGFADRAEVREALIAALDDPEGLVRFGAAGGLEAAGALPEVDRALTPLLDDPLRAVRVQAARALRFRLGPSREAARDYAAYLAHNQDTPSALHERATWSLARGAVRDAVADLERAVALDPRAVALRDTLAVALARDGRPQDAAVHLREAVALAPGDGELWFRLGLAEAGAGAGDRAAEALERAVATAPDHVRAWTNLGLLRHERGDGARAVEALRRAVALAPDDPDVGYALASVLLARGDAAAARNEARRVLELAPDHPGARAVLDAR